MLTHVSKKGPWSTTIMGTLAERVVKICRAHYQTYNGTAHPFNFPFTFRPSRTQALAHTYTYDYASVANIG